MKFIPFIHNHQIWRVKLCYGSGVQLKSNRGFTWCMSIAELLSWTEIKSK